MVANRRREWVLWLRDNMAQQTGPSIYRDVKRWLRILEMKASGRREGRSLAVQSWRLPMQRLLKWQVQARHDYYYVVKIPAVRPHRLATGAVDKLHPATKSTPLPIFSPPLVLSCPSPARITAISANPCAEVTSGEGDESEDFFSTVPWPPPSVVLTAQVEEQFSPIFM